MHTNAAGIPATLAGERPRVSAAERVGPYGAVLLGFSVVLMIWLGAFHFIRKEEAQTTTAALQNSANLARAFEEQLVRSLRAADQTLLYVRDSFARDPDRFDISPWTRDGQFLRDFSFQLAIIDARGMMVASNFGGGVTTPVDLSDREHFRVHVGHDRDELFVSKPVFGRVSGKWSIQVTRRITMPDGSFGGVVVVSLDPEYLANFYASIDIGENGSVAAVGRDGIVRARAARGSGGIGASLAESPLFPALARSTAGHYVATSLVDRIERLFTYRALQSYPLVVVIGLASSEVYAKFERDRRDYIIVAALLTLLLAGATILISRHERRVARARDAAEAGTRARSEFLAMMSHEIRTPMNGVVGMADLLLDSGLSHDQTRLATTLKDSAEHLLQIINDVLDFSKLEADRLELDHITFDIRRVTRGAAEILASRAREKKIDLAVEIDDDVPARVVGDPARLRQVLLNLVGNGVKFTNAGGVRVSVSRVAIPHLSADRARLVFRVRDTGIRIPADAQGLLFRQFSQIDRSISRRFGGTGLGLVICKRLVSLMGGDIRVESEQGRGSVFEFTIEARVWTQPDETSDEAPAAAARGDIDIAAAFARSGARILLAEDNETNQVVATKLLATLGLEAEIVGNGVAAVSAWSERGHDLVLMDVMMPEMDGIAATRAIRSMTNRPRPYILALTANALGGDEETCRRAGMDDFLAKPFTRKSLREAIERFLVVSGAAHAPSPAAEAALVPRSSAPAFAPHIFEELAEAVGADGADAVLAIFLRDARGRLEALRAAASRGDRDALAREAHALKSSAAAVGFAQLSDLAREFEHRAGELPTARVDATIEALEASFAEGEARVVGPDTRAAA